MRIIVFGLVVACTGVASALGAETLPFPLAEWMKGKAHLLPPVDTAVVRQFKEDWATLQTPDGPDAGAQLSEKGVAALKRIVELGPAASLATIWLYVFEDPSLGGEGLGTWRDRLVQTWAQDSSIGRWAVPIYRAQMDFLEAEIAKGESIVDVVNLGGLAGLIGIAYPFGTDEDFERCVSMEEKFFAALPEEIRGTPISRKSRVRSREIMRQELIRPRLVFELYRPLLEFQKGREDAPKPKRSQIMPTNSPDNNSPTGTTKPPQPQIVPAAQHEGPSLNRRHIGVTSAVSLCSVPCLRIESGRVLPRIPDAYFISVQEKTV